MKSEARMTTIHNKRWGNPKVSPSHLAHKVPFQILDQVGPNLTVLLRVPSLNSQMVQGPLMAGHLQGPRNFTTQLDHLLSLVTQL